MSRSPSTSPAVRRVQTDAAFAKAVQAACRQRNWNRPALAAQARVPLIAVHAIYRRAPVLPEAISAICRCLELPLPPFMDLATLRKLGQLLRDRRESAGLSRKALGRLAKLSDSTVKFVETGLHPPSRATCLRLLSVAALNLQWSDLAPFAGLPPESGLPSSDPPVFRLDPRLSVEMVREQMLIIDQLLLHQEGAECSPAGWRRACWLCGTRSATTASRVEDVHHLTLRHSVACIGRLAESLVHRYPILREIAQTERFSRLTPTARIIHLERQHAMVAELLGCRPVADLGELLAHASVAPASPYRSGVVSAVLWALALGPCPLGFTADPFAEATARGLLAAASELGIPTARPVDFLQGVSETVIWILEPHAAPPQELLLSGTQAVSCSDPSYPSSR